MDDVARKLASLERRVRLQALVFIGVLALLLSAIGGADVFARAAVTFTESEVWKIQTRNASSTLVPRISATGDSDQARIKFANAHIELAQQSTTPATPAAGAVWFDSTTGVNKVKYYNGTAWVEVGPAPREKRTASAAHATTSPTTRR